MTQFSQIELLFNQYLNLSKEIDNSIQNEEYFEAEEKIESRGKLVKKIYLAQKTAKLDEEQKQKFQSIKQKIEEIQNNQIKSLTQLREQTGIELKKTKGKVKVNIAYDLSPTKIKGSLVDITE